jgi:hypothetical protein
MRKGLTPSRTVNAAEPMYPRLIESRRGPTAIEPIFSQPGSGINHPMSIIILPGINAWSWLKA